MQIIRPATFKADESWGAMDTANMNGVSTRLHWTDQPYHWHVNDGNEVLIVVDGVVDMHYKHNGKTEKHCLKYP